MSKPTKEIIEASSKLHDLGVKKEPEVGDWKLYHGEAFLIEGAFHIESAIRDEHVVIPPLEWCLGWLEDLALFNRIELRSSEKNGWWCKLRNEFMALISTNHADKHLVVLKAMLAVAKAKK